MDSNSSRGNCAHCVIYVTIGWRREEGGQGRGGGTPSVELSIILRSRAPDPLDYGES